NYFPEKKAVGEERKMMTVLFESGDRNNHRRFPGQRSNRRPAHVAKVHAPDFARAAAAWRVECALGDESRHSTPGGASCCGCRQIRCRRSGAVRECRREDSKN